MYKKYNDQELIRFLSLDNAEAFEEIYNRFALDMFLYAGNILNKKEVCEDIVQNIFIDLWSKRNHLKINNVPSYLFRAVKYQVFNHLRSRRFTSENLIRLNIIDISIDISKKMEYDELEKIIDSYVDELPKRCKQIFLLSRYQHKSNKEIAEELEISLQAVKNQISKALNYIRQNLQQEELAFYFVILFK